MSSFLKMKHEQITIEQALLYEIATMPNWMLYLAGYKWYNHLLARYNVWKTRRKYALYLAHMKSKKNLDEQ